MRVLEVSEVRATPRLLGIFLLMSLLAALELMEKHTISTWTFQIIAIIMGFILSMRLLTELSARQAFKLYIRREFLDPLIEGSNVRIRVVIENRGIIPLLKTTITDRYPRYFRLVKGNNTVESIILPRSRISYTYSVKVILGEHRFEGIELIVSDPVKLFNYRVVADPEKSLVKVKPRPIALPRRLWITVASRGLGLGKVRLKGIGQEFMDLREYVPGDDYRFIEWKSYARTRKLYVKEFEREASLSLIIVLNASKDGIRGVVGNTVLEAMTRTAAGIARSVLWRGDWLDVVMAGSTFKRAGYGRGKPHFYRVLDVLSSFRWDNVYDDAPLPEVLMREISMLPRRGKHYFIVFTPLLSEEEALMLIDKTRILRANRHIVTVVQAVPELFEEEVVSGRETSLFAALVYENVLRARRVSELLRKNGLTVINTGPRDMYPLVLGLIEKYRALSI